MVDRRASDPFAPHPPRTAMPEPPASPEPSGDGLEELTKAELQDLAKQHRLSTAGNKPDLIDRIRAAT
jgi:SAP domain